MYNLNDEIQNNDIETYCKKIDFLLRCLSVHVNQIMSLTQDYVNYLNRNDDQNFPKKRRYFELVDVKTDYAECINEIRDALNNEEKALGESKIAHYRHQLVAQIAKSIHMSQRWSKVLVMFQSSCDEKFIGLWRESMQRFERMDYIHY